MGIFDQIKSAFSKPEDEVVKQEVTAPPETAANAQPAATAATVESSVETADTSARTYTVESGDTLWKIAEKMYGDGSQYPKIFEANRELLDSADQILPGQELNIP